MLLRYPYEIGAQAHRALGLALLIVPTSSFLVNGRFARRVQLVAATHSANLSAGV
jgi:hypothetical protein